MHQFGHKLETQVYDHSPLTDEKNRYSSTYATTETRCFVDIASARSIH